MAETLYRGVENLGGFPGIQAGPLSGRPESPQGFPVYLVVEPGSLYLTRYDGAAWTPIGASESAASILAKLLTVDADNAGINASTLQSRPPGDFQLRSEKGQAGGYVGTDPTTNKIPAAHIPDSILGNLNFQGTWDAQANTPNIGLSPVEGGYWVVSVAGSTSLGGIAQWSVGDWAIYDGAAWSKLDRTVTPAEIMALSRVRKDGALIDFSTEVDFVGPGVIVDTYEATPGDPQTKRIRATISGAAAGPASATSAGVTKLSVPPTTAADPVAIGENDPRVADRFGSVKPSSSVFSGVQAANASLTSGDLRGVNGVPVDAKGVWIVAEATASTAGAARMFFDSADVATLDGFSARLGYDNTTFSTGVLPVPLGTGANAGKIKALVGTLPVTSTFIVYVRGWWR